MAARVGDSAELERRWQHTPTLYSANVTAVPYVASRHLNAKYAVGGTDVEIWRYIPGSPDSFATPAALGAFLDSRIALGATTSPPNQLIFTLLDPHRTNAVMGSYALMNMGYANRVGELGHIWFAKDYRGGGFNTEVAYMMLAYCFDVLHCHRVVWKCDSRNLRSRAAATKLGAQYEGMLRDSLIIKDGQQQRSW
jgi:RimJ/RimL family protein N-acetyltransferase